MLNLKTFLMTLGFTRLVSGGSLIRSVWTLPKYWPIGWMWVKTSLWNRTTFQSQQVTFQRKKTDKRVTVGGKRQRDHLSQAQTLSAGQLMNAARIKQDSSILLHTEDRDCVAMEVWYHKSCSRQYTSFMTKSDVTLTGTADEEVEPTFNASYNIFCERIIRQRIIVNQEVLRMNQLRPMFLNTMQKHEDCDASNYRQDKLKRRLTLDFPQLVFQAQHLRTVFC
ncbi:uncharacterized protein [Nerophis lumbriciformis]|uniref:uncharacterized protein isoform X2 n=1 Tax=Nerophis lumbriciformis TaxID=546530 RepID=UPI002ADF5EAB|nr:uncharacterized protein LOC133617561 isoform X2 [Nerophis lumbriciformis]